MVRVLHVSYLGGLGGGEVMWLSQLRALDRSAWVPYVLCGSEGAFVEELRAANIPVQVMSFTPPSFRYGWLPTASLPFFLRVWRYLRAQRIALVHCKDPESAYYFAPVARFLRLPVIWTCTAWWHAERGWKSRFYEKFFARILTWTQEIKQALVATNPRLGEKITVIPSGVDVNEFAPRPRDEMLLDELRIPREAQIVLLLARFQVVKGHEFFLDAALRILERLPDTRFLIVGDNAFGEARDEAYKRKILQRIQEDERLRARVIVTGFRRDIPRLLNTSHVLVCSSLYETYGMANLEAMACGVPVVSTNVGGPRETIVEGETGFLVAPRDPEAIAQRVIALLADPALRERMGARGRQRVVEHYALTTNVARLQQVYRDVLCSTLKGSLATNSTN